ncbi:protein kinase [Streptomyces longwoodensis]|uniref:protein kinase domain-containing protein n=1 Tax=Streptomyces longwoodensis TaxID=68231 RepID=UPI0036FB6B3D
MSDRTTPPSPTAHESAALRQTGAAPLRPGDPVRVGPHVPLALLGSGGMGRVYLARSADDEPGLYAVKVIRPEYAEDTRFQRRFAHEAAVHSRVGPPHAPRLCGTGLDDDLLWMATKYLPGVDLAAVVREDGSLAAAAVWQLLADLGRALLALSAAGVVHRDLKPSNVLLCPDGAHVIDFGISKAVDASAVTGTGNRVGTPAYMSPEYLRTGHCDTASDVFSLAGSLVYAAAGRGPFGDGTGVDVMHRVAFEEPDPDVIGAVRAGDPDLGTLLTRCLAKEPADRPTPQDLVDAAEPHVPVAGWPEPVHSRVLARQRAYDTLHRLPVARAALLWPPGVRARAGLLPVDGSGQGGPGTDGRPRDRQGVGPYGRPQDRQAAEAHGGPQGRERAHSPGAGQPGPIPAPSADAAPAALRARRLRRRQTLAVTAGVTLSAVAAGVLVLTREDGPATAHAPGAVATASGALPGGARGGGASPSASRVSDGASVAGEPGGQAVTGSEGPGRQPAPPTGPAHATAAPTGTASPAATAGDPTGPAPATSAPASAPAAQPWNTDCTSYEGSGRTGPGDTGKRVRQVQCMLTARGYGVAGTDPDGEFGTGTEQAVRAFQGDRGLTANGVVTRGTWVALRAAE